MLASGRSRVKVRLDHERQAASNDTVAVAPAQRRLHAAGAFVWHALHQPHIESDFVPFDDGAFDLKKWQSDACLPALWALEDQVVQRLAQLCIGTGVRIRKVVRQCVVLAVILELLGRHRRAKKVLQVCEHVLGRICQRSWLWIRVNDIYIRAGGCHCRH